MWSKNAGFRKMVCVTGTVIISDSICKAYISNHNRYNIEHIPTSHLVDQNYKDI